MDKSGECAFCRMKNRLNYQNLTHSRMPVQPDRLPENYGQDGAFRRVGMADRMYVHESVPAGRYGIDSSAKPYSADDSDSGSYASFGSDSSNSEIYSAGADYAAGGEYECN